MTTNSRETHRDEALQKNLLTRLNRIEGQIRGIRAMIERDAYCDDVLSQITAARSALDAAGKALLENHIRDCVVGDIQNGEQKAVDALLHTIGKLLR